MLFIESKTSESRIDRALRLSLLERLQERGFVPLIRSARLQAYETALVGTDRAAEMEREFVAWANGVEDTEYVRGDIFCFEDFVLFLIFDDAENTRAHLRAGIVYTAEMTEARTELDAFCRNLSEALNNVRDNGADYLLETIEWEDGSPEELPGASASADVDRIDAVRSEVPIEMSRAAEGLEDAGARRLLRRISEAHADGSSSDLLASFKGKTETEALLRSMALTGLLRHEVVISCRQVERPLFRLPSPDALGAILGSRAICSECGANLADEKIEELFVPTDVAATLLEDASWLNNILRNTCRQLGLTEEQVVDLPAPEDREAYLMGNVCRESFLFALKDGDMTATHARHALGKQYETDAEHLVVVATGKIQDEARARLREHARRRSHGESLFEVVLIEGVETLASELRGAFERVSERALAEELSALDSSLGLSVGHMLTTRFRLMRRSGALKDLTISDRGTLATGLAKG